jgi:hypothetical protein
MAEEYSFPAYEERLEKIIDKFGGKKMDTYNGQDMTPLDDMKGGGITWSFKRLYAVPKLDKIVFSVQSYRDKLMTYTTLAWPDDQHALPIYSSFWAESAKGSYFIIDLYPTADCICDLPYMENYLDPLEDFYNNGIKHFPEKPKRDINWFRALSSPYNLTLDLGASTKDTQEKLLTLTTDYLEHYYNIWKKDEPREAEYMKRLNERKQAIRKIMKERDPGGAMLESAVGEELTQLTLNALF